jgi:hypothetical protein
VKIEKIEECSLNKEDQNHIRRTKYEAGKEEGDEVKNGQVKGEEECGRVVWWCSVL